MTPPRIFTDNMNIEEVNEFLYRDEVQDLLDTGDSLWDLNMDDESTDFDAYLESGYEY